MGGGNLAVMKKVMEVMEVMMEVMDVVDVMKGVACCE